MYHFLLLLLMLVSVPAAHAGNRETISFSMTTSGLGLGELTFDRVSNSNDYYLRVSVISRGILGFITQAQFDARTVGKLDNSGRMQPETFHALSESLFKSRTTDLSFRSGIPVTTRIKPQSARTRLSDPNKLTGSYTDSLTALALIATTTPPDCPPEIRIYDGRRIVLIRLAPAATFSPGLLRCQGSYRIVDGPDHTLLPGQKTFALTLDYSLAGTTADLIGATITTSHNSMILTRE
ncbi:MAG: DUF3108 domain-containing protein [Rhodobacteraceae bacterium]|nr:DUF3108 domain-containing protein [Paracoccaceae bacterium]